MTIKLENHFIVEKYSVYEESGLVATSYCRVGNERQKTHTVQGLREMADMNDSWLW